MRSRKKMETFWFLWLWFRHAMTPLTTTIFYFHRVISAAFTTPLTTPTSENQPDVKPHNVTNLLTCHCYSFSRRTKSCGVTTQIKISDSWDFLQEERRGIQRKRSCAPVVLTPCTPPPPPIFEVWKGDCFGLQQQWLVPAPSGPYKAH